MQVHALRRFAEVSADAVMSYTVSAPILFDPKILPKPFARLAASEIEDCLCIYKDELLGGARDNFVAAQVALLQDGLAADFSCLVSLHS